MKLAHNLNRTVLVAIPSFFDDDDARECRLVDVDSAGLWLACDELKDRLGPAREIAGEWSGPVTGFFPFTQILYVVDPSQFAALVRGPRKPPVSPPAAQAEARDADREPHHREGRSEPGHREGRSRKGTKGRR